MPVRNVNHNIHSYGNWNEKQEILFLEIWINESFNAERSTSWSWYRDWNQHHSKWTFVLAHCVSGMFAICSLYWIDCPLNNPTSNGKPQLVDYLQKIANNSLYLFSFRKWKCLSKRPIVFKTLLSFSYFRWKMKALGHILIHLITNWLIIYHVYLIFGINLKMGPW